MDNHRIRQIMTILLQEKKVIAKDLAVRFGVSLESIRRDLSQLEQQGTVRKFYGGAELVEELLPDGEAEVFQVRLTERGAEKQAIARAAAALIGDGETVYLDSGTTAAALIPYLKERRGLTVITRSLRSAAQLGMCEELTVYCLGGAVKVDTLTSTGFMAQECLNYFSHIDTVILSGDGLVPQQGVVDFGMENLAFKRSLISRAGRVVVVVDSSKFGRTAHCLTCPTECITTLITDENAPADALETLRARGVDVIVAAV
jgi:DeoR/GlpR family transcriptional regulator of sugar metabolism